MALATWAKGWAPMSSWARKRSWPKSSCWRRILSTTSDGDPTISIIPGPVNAPKSRRDSEPSG